MAEASEKSAVLVLCLLCLVPKGTSQNDGSVSPANPQMVRGNGGENS